MKPIKDKSERKTKGIMIYLTEDEKNLIKERMKTSGFSSLAEFVRVMSIKGELNIK